MGLPLIKELTVFTLAYRKLIGYKGTLSNYLEELGKIHNYKDSKFKTAIDNLDMEYDTNIDNAFNGFLCDIVSEINDYMRDFKRVLRSFLLNPQLTPSTEAKSENKGYDHFAELVYKLSDGGVGVDRILNSIKDISKEVKIEADFSNEAKELINAVANYPLENDTTDDAKNEEFIRTYYSNLKSTWNKYSKQVINIIGLDSPLLEYQKKYFRNLRNTIRSLEDVTSAAAESQDNIGTIVNELKNASSSSRTVFASVATRLVKSGVLSKIKRSDVDNADGAAPKLYAYKIKKYLKEFLEAYSMSTTPEFKKIARQKTMNNALMRLKSLLQLMIGDVPSLKIKHKSITLKSLDEMKGHQESKNLVTNIENMIKKSQEKLKKKPKK